MIESFLIPEKTVVTSNGDGAALDLSGAGNRVFLLTLKITGIVEQESLDVSVWGSANGTEWGPKPLAAFPQKFYPSEYPLLLDLTPKPEIKFLRAHWIVNRWGRGPEKPMFEFQLGLKEVPQDVLQAAR
jgi:hypothetical protein